MCVRQMHILFLVWLYHQEDLSKSYKINKLAPRIEIIEDQKLGIDDLIESSNDRHLIVESHDRKLG